MIPLKINSKHLCEIFEPEVDFSGMSEQEILNYSLRACMLPTSVTDTSQTYSRDAERTADYELENLTLVNRKAKPEFVWSLIRADYVKNLLSFLDYHYNFKDAAGIVQPREADIINITYMDFTGMRTIRAYLGQTIEGTLVSYENILYWESFRIAFPER